MEIRGLNKLTLLDYPGLLACTVFTGGCSLRCPFCQNAALVLSPDSQPLIAMEEFFYFLEKRKNVLEGICITGGEPVLSEELPFFIRKVKELGYLVKLDTNGCRPEVLRMLIKQKLLDYIAMDIKNSKEKYPATCGYDRLDIRPYEESADIIMNAGIPYEFRTTVTKTFHTMEDFLAIASWLHGARAYYLQAFVDSGRLIGNGITGMSEEGLKEIQQRISGSFQKIGIRGIDGIV